jgi:hypothetical protein
MLHDRVKTRKILRLVTLGARGRRSDALGAVRPVTIRAAPRYFSVR